MGRSTEITYERVAAAAAELRSEGIHPSGPKVRERLGNTGSASTIAPFLKSWHEANPLPTAAAPELPQALAAALSAEILRASSAARADIEQALVEARTEIEEVAAACETVEKERDELTEQVTYLTRDRDVLFAKAAQQTAEIDRLRATLEAAEAARVEADKRAAVLDAKLVSAVERLQDAADARADADKAKDEARKEAAAAREQVARLEGQLEAHKTSTRT